ncbi:MAG: flagellar biosynthesis anti-sigma factor FlgM [Nitrospiria bacterium]
MKIPEKDPNVLLERALLGKRSGVNDVKQADVSKSHEAAKPSSVDPVDISEKARTLQQLNQLVAAETDVRTERVEEIQQAIATGAYAPNAEKIAEKLVRSTLLDNTL